MSATPAKKFDSVSALRDAITSKVDPAYVAHMYQPIPDLPTIKDRAAYLIEKAKGKVVLDIGCTGPISARVRMSASKYYGIDKVDGDCIVGVDLNHRPDLMPVFDDVEVVICSEILEHLSNPGYFLMALKEKYPKRLVYITVPNAGAYVVKDKCELVNAEHVCWYSYATLKQLLTRYDFEIKEARWGHGEPYTAAGVIMVAEG